MTSSSRPIAEIATADAAGAAALACAAIDRILAGIAAERASGHHDPAVDADILDLTEALHGRRRAAA